MRIDHGYVETRHWDRAVAFWTALGFEFRERWGDEGHRAGLLARGDARIVLAECGAGGPQRATVHFHVPDLEAVTARAVAAGAVDVETPLGPTHWGTRWMRVRDPDGNLWALES